MNEIIHKAYVSQHGVMAVTLRYFTKFGKPVRTASICAWSNLCTRVYLNL